MALSVALLLGLLGKIIKFLNSFIGLKWLTDQILRHADQSKEIIVVGTRRVEQHTIL